MTFVVSKVPASVAKRLLSTVLPYMVHSTVKSDTHAVEPQSFKTRRTVLVHECCFRYIRGL